MFVVVVVVLVSGLTDLAGTPNVKLLADGCKFAFVMLLPNLKPPVVDSPNDALGSDDFAGTSLAAKSDFVKLNLTAGAAVVVVVAVSQLGGTPNLKFTVVLVVTTFLPTEVVLVLSLLALGVASDTAGLELFTLSATSLLSLPLLVTSFLGETEVGFIPKLKPLPPDGNVVALVVLPKTKPVMFSVSVF